MITTRHEALASHTERQRKSHSHIVLVIAALMIVFGCCVMLYPPVDQYVYMQNEKVLKQEFMQLTRPKEGVNGPYEELYQYLKSKNELLYLTGQVGLVDAFSYQTAGVDLSKYGIEGDCIGFIELPTIDMELPLYLGANTENMKKGAVHLTQTSYPIGGNNTNCVIAAHRGTSKVMFRNIHKIEIGDPVYITNFREKLEYKAVEIKIIKPDEIDKVLIQKGRDLVTLITCNPLGANYQRYVVYCERQA